MSTPQEELLKAIAGAGAKTKASLMSGINSAGQQYFQAPYNIPSTFGNYYVGSPTAAVSDFVPLPLDFLEQKLSDIQADYDLANLSLEAAPGELEKQVPLAPYHEQYRPLIIGDANQRIEQLSKDLLRDPTRTAATAQALKKLQSDIMQNKYYKDYSQTGYKYWTDVVQPAMKEKGFETGIIGQGFWDPATGQYKQINAVAPEIIANDWQKFFNDNLMPDFTASMDMQLKSAGIERDPETGVLYDVKTKEQIKGIDPDNPVYGKFYKRAINDLAYLIYTGQGDQFRIAREVEGLDTLDKAKDYVERMVSQQFYQEKTDAGELKTISAKNVGGGGGKSATQETTSIKTFDIPVENAFPTLPPTYKERKQQVDNNTYQTENTAIEGITPTPYRTIQEVSTALNLPANYFSNTSDGQLVKTPNGQPFVLKNQTINKDILGRNPDWGPLNIQGSVDYSFVKVGNDLLPVISKLNLSDGSGPIKEDSDLYREINGALVTKQVRDITNKKDLQYITDNTANAELDLFKGKTPANVKVSDVPNLISKTRQKAVELYYPDVEITNEAQAQDLYEMMVSEKGYEAKLLNLFKNSPNEEIADIISEKFATSPSASTKAVSFLQMTSAQGGQRTSESLTELSRIEADLIASLGKYDNEGMYSGNELLLNNVLRQTQVIDENGNSKSLSDYGLSSGQDYKDYKAQINYGGFGFSANGTPYYYGILQLNNPDPGITKRDRSNINGARVKIPITAMPEFAKDFMDALNVPKSAAIYAQVIGNAIGSGKSGVLLDLNKEAPWVKGASSITWERPTYTSEGQGGAVNIKVTFKTPQEVPNQSEPVKSYIIRATDAFDAGVQLHDLNAYYLYQDAFNNYQGGTGGSSTGMGKQIK